MAKLKRYQLLERAMRDYPAGTVSRFKSAPNVDHISDGIFKILDINKDGSTNVFSGSGLNCFYSSHDEGKFIGEWAVPVPDSLLSGNCAIQVNNAREFKLLMEHYEQKGWKYFSGVLPTSSSFFVWSPDRSSAVSYHDGFSHSQLDYFKNEGYKVILFADFAAEVGIDVPVFVLTSEDGVDLYEGDNGHHVFRGHGSWSYNGTNKITDRLVPIEAKVFSTKEAAEAWIAKANKPKELNVKLFGGGKATITSNTVVLQYPDSDKIQLKPSDLEDMLHALQTLQEAPE